MALPATRNGLSLLEDTAELSPVGLRFLRDLSFDEWQEYGRRLRFAHGAMLWWIGDWLRYGERRYGEMYVQALDGTDYAYQTLMNAVWVAGRFDETSRRREILSFSHHAEVATKDLERAEADALLDAAEEHGWSQKELRKAVRTYLHERDSTEPGELPPGQYDVILADPPWRYDFAPTDSASIERHYPTLEVEKICALVPPAADDAALFLWATAPKLREALQVLDAWGFEYKTHAVWDKRRVGMGYWFLGRHELLLVGTRGDFSPPPPEARVASVLEEDRGPHSRKPSVAYDVIETAFPSARRLEMFARSGREGWTVWGDQAEDAA